MATNMQTSFRKIRTGVSGAFWCDPASLKFEMACRPESPGLQVCWLDELLGGGLVVPDTSAPQATRDMPTRAITLLLTGPPGTGKSTFATELCYRWAAAGDPVLKRFYYATTEADPTWLIRNARQHWGPDVESQFQQKIKVVEYAPYAKTRASSNSTERALAALLGLGPIKSKIKELLWPLDESDKPDVVVVDSLNAIPNDPDKREWLKEIFAIIRNGPKLVILIMDAGAGASSALEFWEYISDIIIRLDHTRPTSPAEGYLLRTIEIVKARYQPHAWGPHQLKIYEPYNDGAEKTEVRDGDGPKRNFDRLQRAHPFREQGGIFVYPSIHYLLSSYKRSDPTLGPNTVRPKILALEAMLEGGFPEGRCTAFLGVRGGHKSYLGFMHVVDRVALHDECGLIVSLRDDVGTTVDSVTKIIKDWAEDESENAENRGRYLELQKNWQGALRKRLEIMYFPPGNITPEEFLHRILLSVWRLRQKDDIRGRERNVTVLFNSLDQLAARFPLCAKEPVFIAALLQLLSANRVTSLFVAASRRADDATFHGPDSIHGLDSIAELILDFQHANNLNLEQHGQALGNLFDIRTDLPRPGPEQLKKLAQGWSGSSDRPQVMIRVVRYAGGHPAGARAVLDLVDDKHPLRPHIPCGLQCFPLGGP